jgi:ABC-type amino acid transport substrate-binding protein
MKDCLLRNLFSLLCLWLLSLGTHSFASLPGNESAIGQRTTIALSDTERQWVMEHPVIRLGVDPAWPPFDFIDRQGVHRGMAADFLQLLVQRLGISVEMIPDIGWNQALERARDRSLDLVSLSHGTPERDYPGIKIRQVASALDGLRAVASGQVKAMVESLAVASYLISENNLVNLRIADGVRIWCSLGLAAAGRVAEPCNPQPLKG